MTALEKYPNLLGQLNAWFSAKVAEQGAPESLLATKKRRHKKMRIVLGILLVIGFVALFSGLHGVESEPASPLQLTELIFVLLVLFALFLTFSMEDVENLWFNQVMCHRDFVELNTENFSKEENLMLCLLIRDCPTWRNAVQDEYLEAILKRHEKQHKLELLRSRCDSLLSSGSTDKQCSCH